MINRPAAHGNPDSPLSTVLGEADRTIIDDLRSFAQERKIRLSICAIDEAAPNADAPLFDTGHMRKLYTMGEEEGRAQDGCLISTSIHSPIIRP